MAVPLLKGARKHSPTLLEDGEESRSSLGPALRWPKSQLSFIPSKLIYSLPKKDISKPHPGVDPVFPDGAGWYRHQAWVSLLGCQKTGWLLDGSVTMGGLNSRNLFPRFWRLEVLDIFRAGFSYDLSPRLAGGHLAASSVVRLHHWCLLLIRTPVL